jgi:hypothetical protein
MDLFNRVAEKIGGVGQRLREFKTGLDHLLIQHQIKYTLGNFVCAGMGVYATGQQLDGTIVDQLPEPIKYLAGFYAMTIAGAAVSLWHISRLEEKYPNVRPSDKSGKKVKKVGRAEIDRMVGAIPQEQFDNSRQSVLDRRTNFTVGSANDTSENSLERLFTVYTN